MTRMHLYNSDNDLRIECDKVKIGSRKYDNLILVINLQWKEKKYFSMSSKVKTGINVIE